jgi:hypothetical protein
VTGAAIVFAALAGAAAGLAVSLVKVRLLRRFVGPPVPQIPPSLEVQQTELRRRGSSTSPRSSFPRTES